MNKWDDWSRYLISTIDDLKKSNENFYTQITLLKKEINDLREKQLIDHLTNKSNITINKIKYGVISLFLGTIPTIIAGIALYLKYQDLIVKFLKNTVK